MSCVRARPRLRFPVTLRQRRHIAALVPSHVNVHVEADGLDEACSTPGCILFGSALPAACMHGHVDRSGETKHLHLHIHIIILPHINLWTSLLFERIDVTQIPAAGTRTPRPVHSCEAARGAGEQALDTARWWYIRGSRTANANCTEQQSWDDSIGKRAKAEGCLTLFP